MLFCCDLDWVLHDYSLPFIKIAKEHGVDINKSAWDGMSNPIQFFEDICGRKKATQVVHEVNCLEKWHPTRFAKHIVRFLKAEWKNGNEVWIITARESRTGAESIIREIFGKIEIPIISCAAKNKHIFVRGASIFFEDTPNIAHDCAKNNPNTRIIVPDWPWNREEIIQQSFDNLKYVPQKDFANISKIVGCGCSKTTMGCGCCGATK